nr:xylulose kinase-1 [Tanacetum cinerariifolium]
LQKLTSQLELLEEKLSQEDVNQKLLLGLKDFMELLLLRYALTVNPTVYASCVKQFWTTAKVKKVNGQEHIQALVDKQKVIITEESIRCDL